MIVQARHPPDVGSSGLTSVATWCIQGSTGPAGAPGRDGSAGATGVGETGPGYTGESLVLIVLREVRAQVARQQLDAWRAV